MGSKIALRFRLAADADALEWFQGNVLDNPGLQEPPQPFPVTLQTPGVMTEPRLGQCDACEEFIMKHRELDVQRMTHEIVAAQQRAEMEKFEAQRYQMRLAQKPPMLEDPDLNRETGAIRVILQDDRPGAGTTGTEAGGGAASGGAPTLTSPPRPRSTATSPPTS